MEDDWRNPREYFIKGMEEYAGRSIDEVKMLTTHLNDSELINESRVISLAVHKMSLLGKDRRNKEYRKLSNWNAIYHVEKERRGAISVYRGYAHRPEDDPGRHHRRNEKKSGQRGRKNR